MINREDKVKLFENNKKTKLNTFNGRKIKSAPKPENKLPEREKKKQKQIKSFCIKRSVSKDKINTE